MSWFSLSLGTFLFGQILLCCVPLESILLASHQARDTITCLKKLRIVDDYLADVVSSQTTVTPDASIQIYFSVTWFKFSTNSKPKSTWQKLNFQIERGAFALRTANRFTPLDLALSSSMNTTSVHIDNKSSNFFHSTFYIAPCACIAYLKKFQFRQNASRSSFIGILKALHNNIMARRVPDNIWAHSSNSDAWALVLSSAGMVFNGVIIEME